MSSSAIPPGRAPATPESPRPAAALFRLALFGLLAALLAAAGLAAGLWWLGIPGAALLAWWLEPPGRRGWTAFAAVLAAWLAFALRDLTVAGGLAQSGAVMALAGLPGAAAALFWLLPALLAAASAGLAAVAGAGLRAWRRARAGATGTAVPAPPGGASTGS
ncbi:MAG: hypothetical protein IRZ26_04800 [Clostridia bacterium]|nr:hypothetical protein [Clostridia bacterium]MCL6522084.1 hypothetical protein [Bacillota bacterium]